MARTVQDAKLSSRNARRNLKVQGKPHFKGIDAGLHLGYRRGKTGGRWLVRFPAGADYRLETFATADDTSDADGVAVLNFSQAQQKAREIALERQRQALGEVEAVGPYKVVDAMRDYLDHLKDHGKSYDVTRYWIEARILPRLGHVECNALTAKQVRKWHRDLAESAAKLRTRKGEVQKYREDPDDEETTRKRRATANRVLTILKAGLNMAYREGHVLSDDAWRRVKPYPATDAARLRYLTAEEARRLLNACEPDLRDLVAGALATGMRYGELCALTCADYHADAGTVHVRQSKSGKARHVVLTEEGVDVFERLTAGRGGDQSIFLKADGTPWLKGHQVRRFREAVERAKIKPPISFHGLRHTWASLSVMAEMPLMVVAENLGHADTRMVEKHYGHLARSYVAETVRKTAPRFGLATSRNVSRLR